MPGGQQLAEPQPGLRQGGEQQPVTDRTRPLPGRRIPPCAPVHDGLHLPRSQERHRPGRRAADPHRWAWPLPAPPQMRQPRDVTAAIAARPVKPPGHRHLVNVGVVAVEGQHRRDPRRDSRLRERLRLIAGRKTRHPGRDPGAQRGHERDEERQAHLVPGHPGRGQVLPPSGQRGGIRPDRVWRGPLRHPQELQVLLDRPDRKMIFPGHRPGPLPVEHDPLHPHARSSCRRRRRWCGTLDNDTPTWENARSGHAARRYGRAAEDPG
jgi:hypothetical protein